MIDRAGSVVLLVVGCIGLAVRILQYSAGASFWYDEAYLLVNVANKTCEELCGPLRCNQAAPPLFLWTLRGLYLWGGASECLMRLPALLASVTALLIFIPLARQVAGQPGWLWAVGLAVISLHAVTHAVEVKPYTLDLLMTEVILLAIAHGLAAEPRSVAWKWGVSGLMVLAVLGPWLSYPSMFVLTGAGLALVCEAWSRRSRALGLAWLGLNGAMLLSALAVWWIAARHQRTTALETFWQQAFLDLASVEGAILWLSDFLVKLGNYGSTGLGIPLLLLALVGLATLWRQSRSLVVLLVGPLLPALVASGLRLYPLEDRLLFFMVPCLWLSAAAGVSGILTRLPGRFAWPALIVLSALLLPGTVRVAKYLVVVKPKAEFREAFEYVLEHEAPGDLWWVSHPEVAEIYLGSRRPLILPHRAVAQAARGKRLWLVASRTKDGPDFRPALARDLEKVGLKLQAWKDLGTVVVFSYGPDANLEGW